MASPNDGFLYDYSSSSKRPRGLVDPYEIPDSPPPPPPKRQRQPLPAKRLKAFARKQPAPPLQAANQVIQTPSRHSEGYAYGHGNTCGGVPDRLVLKSNGIEDWDGGMPFGPLNTLRETNTWSSTLANSPPMHARGEVVGRSLDVGSVNTPPDRTLKIKDLLRDEEPAIMESVGNTGLRLDAASSTITPRIAPIANLTAPIADMASMNSGNGPSSPIATATYRSPYILPNMKGHGQGYMAQTRTVSTPVTRVFTTSLSPGPLTPTFTAQAVAPSTVSQTAVIPTAPAPSPRMSRTLISTTPGVTAFTSAAGPPVLPPPMALQRMVAPTSITPAIEMRDTRAPEIAAFVPPIPTAANTAPVFSASAPMASALKVPAAPMARAASADLLPEAIPSSRRPNGVEQVARRYSLQDYSVTEYCVVGSPVTRAIRVLRPGADKPLPKDTSPENPGNNVGALTQTYTEGQEAPVAALSSNRDATSAVFGSPKTEGAAAGVLKDTSIHSQGVAAITESNSPKSNRRDMPITAQTSVSSTTSPKPPSSGSLLRRRSEQGAKHPAQLLSLESSTSVNDTSVEQRTMSYLPTPVDDRSKEDEDRSSENGHRFESGIPVVISQGVPKEPNTQYDHLPQEDSSGDVLSRRLATHIDNQINHLPDNSPNDLRVRHSYGQMEKSASEIPSNADNQQTLRDPDTAIEKQIITKYDSLGDTQISGIGAHTTVEAEVDNVQDIDEPATFSVDLDEPVAHETVDLLNNVMDHPHDFETRSNIDREVNVSHGDVQEERACVEPDATMENGHTKMRVTVNGDRPSVDSDAIVASSNDIMGDNGGDGADDSAACKDTNPTKSDANIEMDVSTSPKNHDQSRNQDGTVIAIRAGFREILQKLDDGFHGNDLSNEFDISMDIGISKASQNRSGAQVSTVSAVSETGDSTLSDVEGEWVDTYMETDTDIIEGHANDNDVSGGNNALWLSDDDDREDEEVQVDLIQGHRIDPAGKAEYLVKWKDTNRAVSWESEKQVLDIASDKLYEFFKKIVYENIGPESIVKSKRGPGRPRGSVNKFKTPSLNRESLRPKPKVVEKRDPVLPWGSQNGTARQDVSTVSTLATGIAKSSKSLAKPPLERSLEHTQGSQPSRGVSRKTRKVSSNATVLPEKVIEGSGRLAESPTNGRTERPRRSYSSIARSETLQTAVENTIGIVAAPLEVPVKRGRGRPRKLQLATVAARATKTPAVGEPSALISPQDDDNPHDGSQSNPIHSNSETSTPATMSTAEATPPVSETPSRMYRGGRSGNLSHANEENSPIFPHLVQPTISRPIQRAKRGRGRPRGSGNNVRRRAAEPTLITRIKTMARENRGRPGSRPFGEVVLPLVAGRRRTRAATSESTENAPASQRRGKKLAARSESEASESEAAGEVQESEGEEPKQAEGEPEELHIEESDRDESEIAETGPRASEFTKPRRQARKPRDRPRRVQKQARHGRIAQPTIATRMKSIGRSNRGQPPSRLPGQIIMPWLSRRHKPSANAMEAKEPIDAGMHVEEEFEELEAVKHDMEEMEGEETEPTTTEDRPRRETRNHMPKYHDTLLFDDLEEPTRDSVPKSGKKRRRSSHVAPSTATDEEESQNRPAPTSTEVETHLQKPRGRRPRSGYVKDRWYYAPY